MATRTDHGLVCWHEDRREVLATPWQQQGTRLHDPGRRAQVTFQRVQRHASLGHLDDAINPSKQLEFPVGQGLHSICRPHPGGCRQMRGSHAKALLLDAPTDLRKRLPS